MYEVKPGKIVQFFATFLRFPATCNSFSPSKMADISTPKSPFFFFSFLPSTLSALFSRERAAGTNQTQHGGGEEEEEEAEPHCYSSFHIYGEGGRARNCPRHPKKSPFLFLPPTPGGKREREKELSLGILLLRRAGSGWVGLGSWAKCPWGGGGVGFVRSTWRKPSLQER